MTSARRKRFSSTKRVQNPPKSETVSNQGSTIPQAPKTQSCCPSATGCSTMLVVDDTGRAGVCHSTRPSTRPSLRSARRPLAHLPIFCSRVEVPSAAHGIQRHGLSMEPKLDLSQSCWTSAAPAILLLWSLMSINSST
jgi:hypothetical protein